MSVWPVKAFLPYISPLTRIRIGSFINTVKWWIGNGLTQSPGEIIDAYFKCLIRK